MKKIDFHFYALAAGLFMNLAIYWYELAYWQLALFNIFTLIILLLQKRALILSYVFGGLISLGLIAGHGLYHYQAATDYQLQAQEYTGTITKVITPEKYIFQVKDQKILLRYWYQNLNLKISDKVSIQAKLKPAPQQLKYYYKSQLIQAIADSPKILKKQSNNTLSKQASQLITTLREQLLSYHKAHLGSDDYALLSKIILGRASPERISSQTYKAARDLGLSHVFAASGLHLGLLCFFVYFLLGRFSISSREKKIAIALTATLYCLLGGWSPSLTRAWFLVIIFLLGALGQQRLRFINILLAGAILQLIFSPSLISDLGFQFSYLATLSIFIFINSLNRMLSFIPASWASLITISASAQILTYPLQLAYFGNIMPYFLLANVLAIPLIALILFLSLIICFISLLGPFGIWIATGFEFINAMLITLFTSLIEGMHSLPFSDLSVPPISPFWLIIIYTGIITLSLWKTFKAHQKQAISILIILACSSLLGWQYWAGENTLQIFSSISKHHQALILKHNHRIILICEDDLEFQNNILARDLERKHIRNIDHSIGSCKLSNQFKVKCHKLRPEVTINKLKLNINNQIIQINYPKFKALVLREPVQHISPKQYDLLMLTFDKVEIKKAKWSTLPKAEQCILPYLYSKRRLKAINSMQDNCQNITEHPRKIYTGLFYDFQL